MRETNLKTKEKKKPKMTATPLSAYHVPGNVLNTSWIAFHVVLATRQTRFCYYSLLTDEVTEAQTDNLVQDHPAGSSRTRHRNPNA